MTWLNAPPRAHWQQAVDLLKWLDALDNKGAITATGREMLDTGVHPRLAHMLVRSRENGAAATGAKLAALLSERDVLGVQDGSDIEARLRALEQQKPGKLRGGRIHAVQKLARRLAGACRDDCRDDYHDDCRRRLSRQSSQQAHRCHRRSDPGALLALAFPDRIAKRRPGGRPRFQLSNGKGAWLPDSDPLAASDWLVAAELDGQAREAKIFLAARTDRATIERVLSAHLAETETAEWDERRGTVVVRRERRLGALVLDHKPAGTPTPQQIADGLLNAARARGLEALNWTETARQFCHRVELMRALETDEWPAFDPNRCPAIWNDWLGPFLAGLTHWREVAKLDLMPALENRLGYSRKARLDRLAPPRLGVPAGSPKYESTTAPKAARCWRSSCRRCSAGAKRRASPTAEFRSYSTCSRRPAARWP